MKYYCRSTLVSVQLLLMMAVFFFLIVTGCETAISVPTQPNTPQLSIECMLVPGEVPVLYLSRSTAFFSVQTSADLFVSDARVTVSSAEGVDVLSPEMGRDSFLCQPTYFYRGSIPARQGQTYTMTVVSGGQSYTAQTTISQGKPIINNVGYISAFTDIYGEHEGVTVDFTDIAGQVNDYRYEMRRQIDSSARKTESTYKSLCNGSKLFGVTELGRAIYTDTGIGDGKPISVVVEPTYTHRAGSQGQVVIQAMDPAAGRFYDQLDRQKLATSNPFIEPVFLKTNILGCMGVFGHYVRSEPVPFIFPE